MIVRAAGEKTVHGGVDLAGEDDADEGHLPLFGPVAGRGHDDFGRDGDDGAFQRHHEEDAQVAQVAGPLKPGSDQVVEHAL